MSTSVAWPWVAALPPLFSAAVSTVIVAPWNMDSLLLAGGHSEDGSMAENVSRAIFQY